MNIQDQIRLRGEVVIKSIDSAGVETVLVNDNNLIVENGRVALAKNLYSSSPVYISDVAFGSGGTLLNDSTAPAAINVLDTTLNTPIENLTIGEDYIFGVTGDNPPTSTISFNIVIPIETALNGKEISEMALMLNTTPVSAFAIKHFASITKSSAIAITITWTIYL